MKSDPQIKLWHCDNARSLRPLWAMEEMGIPYELEVLPFPPRFFQKEFLEVKPIGYGSLLYGWRRSDDRVEWYLSII